MGWSHLAYIMGFKHDKNMPQRLPDSPALLVLPEAGHRVWIPAGILNTTRFVVTICVALVQAILCFDKKGNCHFERIQHEGIQCICQSAIMPFFQCKGSAKPLHHTWTFTQTYLLCRGKTVLHSMPDQELGTIARTSLGSKMDFIAGWKTLKVLQYKELHLERNCSV